MLYKPKSLAIIGLGFAGHKGSIPAAAANLFFIFYTNEARVLTFDPEGFMLPPV